MSRQVLRGNTLRNSFYDDYVGNLTHLCFFIANYLWTKNYQTGHSDSRIRTGSNQDFEIQQFGVKYQVLSFQSGFRDLQNDRI